MDILSAVSTLFFLGGFRIVTFYFNKHQLAINAIYVYSLWYIIDLYHMQEVRRMLSCT